ncbi:hypothetical protein B0H16DRAFT_1768429 [Mycena metata]|uniref:Uncharacterized protein n=1 Tax=Mycena metata TaxID=1033252 RepID=A0AAD7MUD6_9AGAR|nr:hypothetical protein B0H16DRAFT_1768429 [Mycena metata]
MPERPYNHSDLLGKTRGELKDLLLKQKDRWPSSMEKFKPSKTNMADMKQALIEAEFTTDLPLLQDALPPLNNPIPPPDPLHNSGPSVVDSRSSAERDFEHKNPANTIQLMPSSGLDIPVYNEPAVPEQRRILLLIDDIRGPIVERVSQRIDVSVIPANQASSSEIGKNLQATISAFEGPARIGVQDGTNPQYVQFFGIIVGQDFADAEAEEAITLLSLPANRTLQLTVASIGGVRLKPPAKRPRSESPINALDEQPGSIPTPDDIIVASTSKEIRTQPILTDKELAWLLNKRKATSGDDIFNKNRNRRLSNLDRTTYWKLAARFDAKYYKVQWPAEVSTKTAIEAVLGMKNTALTSAITAARILGVYYDGSTHKSEEVVKHIEAKDDTEGDGNSGSELLYKFLVKWEKEHPVND